MVVNELAVKKILDELNDVKLIAATKYVGIDEINKLENLGVMYFGENRVQAFLEKYQKYNGNCKFHMIGTLQPNKVKYIIDKVDLIHSVDSYSLIKEIEKGPDKGLSMDVPALNECWRTAPYLYDGRSYSMKDMLKVHGPHKPVTEKELEELEEYVLSL